MSFPRDPGRGYPDPSTPGPQLPGSGDTSSLSRGAEPCRTERVLLARQHARALLRRRRPHVRAIARPRAVASVPARRGHRGENHREAYVPAQQPPPGPASRLPSPHGGSRRPRRAEGPSSQGPEQAVGLIWRIRDRDTFVALRRRGRRVRSGPIWISFVLDEPDRPPSPPRVAFAFGRKHGNAVSRNRLRRRCRAILVDIQRHGAPIPPGAYLVGGSPTAGELPFADLRGHLERCVADIGARAS